MAKIVEYDLGDKLKLRLEEPATVARGGPQDASGKTMRGGVRDVVSDATQSFEDAIAQVGPAAAAIIDQLKAAAPTEIELEFGVKLEAKAGAVITVAGGEAHFKIVLKWKKP